MITKLNCCSNELVSLDIRGLTDLQELYYWENRLTSLNRQGLSHLWFLHCDDNSNPCLTFLVLFSNIVLN